MRGTRHRLGPKQLPGSFRSRPAASRRVAFVLGRDGEGGSELQAKLFVRELRRRGIDVDVFIVEGPGRAEDFGGDSVLSLAPSRKAGLAGALGMLRAWQALRRHVKLGKYDVVHAVMARAYVLAPLATPIRHRPMIVAWRRNEGIHLRNHSLAAGLELISARASDHIVCNSQAVLDYWCSRGHIRRGSAHVIGNALEPYRFDRVEPSDHPAATVRLLCVGGLKPIKGHAMLIEAAARLRRLGLDVEVVIAGEGSLRNELIERSARLGVPLLMPGHVRDSRPWLASADIYVHPSLSEGASNAILEAMAQAVPIVATKVGGTEELLADTGVLVIPNDAQDLADAIGGLIKDPDRARSLGERARERARDRFELSNVVDEHLALYGFSSNS